MIRAAVGTLNPAKVQAVERILNPEEFHVAAVEVSSGVSPQPFSDEETIQGAVNRAAKALEMAGADIGFGLEGGVTETEYGMFLCNWGALVLPNGESILAGGARILLPEDIARSLKQGTELGVIMEEYTKQKNIRQKEGAMGVLTSGQVTRGEMFSHIVKLLVGQYKQRLREQA
jgi:inosine/xanthosine triphosphatase